MIPRRWFVLLGIALALGAVALILPALLRPSARPDQSAEPPIQVAWMFEQHERGAVISTPLVAGNRVYVGAIRDSAFSPGGVVYCLDRDRGKVLWKFDDQGEMKHMYSSPCLGDGRLFIGEGMHANLTCKLYCLDARSGKKQWQFTAAGHIESSPYFDAGKVYFGAGDDGLYCLDAATGELCWHFEAPIHVDSGVAVAGKCLYASSGVSRAYQAPGVLCLDREKGGVLWQIRTDLPAWSSPVVAGDRLFVGLGNGRLTHSAEPPEQPRGALLCLDAANGDVCWRYDMSDGVLVHPALGPRRVYAGSRDHHVYAIDRQRGQLCWKEDLGSPIVAPPTLEDQRLYVAASEGVLCCLDAENGKRLWTLDCAARWRTKPQMFSAPTVVVDSPEGAVERRIYIGGEFRSAVDSAAVVLCLRD
jgi:outer membrane protein assembly factor BamB